MLEIKGLHFRYSRKTPLILNDIDLELESGEIGILLGRNGAGKTTLFRNILGIRKPESGTIRLEGKIC